MNKLAEIIKDSSFKLTQFSEAKKQSLEARITSKANKSGKEEFFTNCLVRKKEIKLTAEEVVRQLFLQNLIEDFGYPTSRFEFFKTRRSHGGCSATRSLQQFF